MKSRKAPRCSAKNQIDDATVRQKASEVATKVLASKLLDGALFRAPSLMHCPAKNTDIRSVAPVAKACADFAKACLTRPVNGFEAPPEVAVRALEDGIGLGRGCGSRLSRAS